MEIQNPIVLDGKQQFFNGFRYRKAESGYFRMMANGENYYLHRAVWEYHFGPLDEGMQVHHLDGDKSNNELRNLIALPKEMHIRWHKLFDEMKPVVKTCPFCGVEFQPDNIRQVYCSAVCRRKRNKQKEKEKRRSA